MTTANSTINGGITFWRGALTILAVLLGVGCTVTQLQDSNGEERQAMSADAAPYYALMRWDPLSEQEAIPAAGASLPDADEPAEQAAMEEAIAALAGDDLDAIRFSPATGELFASSHEREIDTGPDLTDETALLEGVRLILEAAGAREDQLELSVSTLRATGGNRGEEMVGHDVAKIVHIARKVNGVYLALDHGHASFGMDGRFISLRFQWRRLDYMGSVLAVHGVEDEDDVMALVAEGLADLGVALRPSVHAIDVATYYLAEPPSDPASELWTVHLIGAAGLRDSNGNGMGSEGSIPGYAFHIDGSGPLLPEVD